MFKAILVIIICGIGRDVFGSRKKKYQEKVVNPSQNWKALGANKFPRTVDQEGLL